MALPPAVRPEDPVEPGADGDDEEVPKIPQNCGVSTVTRMSTLSDFSVALAVTESW